jgi:KH domain
MARREIQKIIDERTSNVNMHLKDIPPELYPFLAGPRQSNLPAIAGGHDINVTIPHYHTWVDTPPAQSPNPGRPAVFVPQQSLPIRISGDRRAAQEARERIEREAEALRRQLTSYEVPIERGRHQFIVGPEGDFLHDFIAETGCSIVMPPSNDDSETLYVIGPADKIDNAVNKIMDIAASMSVSNIDVARQHTKAPLTHAYNLARYLQERQAIASLEQQFSANFVLPNSTNAPASWQIFSQDGKQGMKARAEAMGLIAGHPPSRFSSMTVNPFYHPHLRGQTGQLRRDHGVHLLFPPLEDPDSHEIILIYECPGSPSEYQFPRQAPTPAQVQEYQQALQEVMTQLISIIGDDDDIISHHYEAPPK